MAGYKPRYEGARWAVVYGSYAGVEQFALDELQRMVQRFLPYVLGVHGRADGELLERHHLILLGTPADNPLVEEVVRRGLVPPPPGPQGYTIAGLASPWNGERRLVVIAGHDALGVLYGVEDFNARVLAAKVEPDNPTPMRLRNALDEMKAFSFCERPLIENRGLWTWGYVIYDYRRFIDNMARLRMNSIIVWNDCPPANCAEFISYARARGIGVILAFHWGWGTNLDIARQKDHLTIKRDVLRKYSKEYAHLDIDGIYFQTQTEHDQTSLGGRSTASLACSLVNLVSAALLEKKPDLKIYFGLHATSILDTYQDLAALDERVTIAWEDCGVMPFSYDPLTELPADNATKGARTAEETLAYCKRLASLRPGGLFAMVPKGWTCLDWRGEFEHHGSFILGERDREFTRARLASRQTRWDYVNGLWSADYPKAQRFYREMLDVTDGNIAAWGLVEDGIFEEAIQPSVALFANMLWDPTMPDNRLLANVTGACDPGAQAP